MRRDFGCFACLALVVAIWIGIGWIPGTVEPVEAGFIVGDPFLDRLPGWFDRLHRLDVEGRRWRARERDDSLPEAVEAEEELSTLLRTPYQSAFGIQEMLTEVSNEYSISPRRMTLRTGFMMPLQHGHSSGSPPQTWRIRSRQRGCMSRADCFGGAGMRRMVDWIFEIGDLRLGEDSGGRMMRSGMSGVFPRRLPGCVIPHFPALHSSPRLQQAGRADALALSEGPPAESKVLAALAALLWLSFTNSGHPAW